MNYPAKYNLQKQGPGRKKGSKGLKTKQLEAILDEVLDGKSIPEAMFDVIKELEKDPMTNKIDIGHLKIQVLMRMMDYVYPKRKPQDPPAEDGVTVDPVLQRLQAMKPDEREARLIELKGNAG